MIVPGKLQPAAIPLSGDLAVSPSHVRVQGIGSSPKYRIPNPPARFADSRAMQSRRRPVRAREQSLFPCTQPRRAGRARPAVLKERGSSGDFGGLHLNEGGAWLPSPGLREAEIASAFNYSLSTYQMLVHLLHMNAD